MRWLLLKDLQILRRSPVLMLLLVAYSAAIAVMIGSATRETDAKPRVAFLNQIPADEDEFVVAGQRLKASRYADELFKSVDAVTVTTRAEAVEKVRDGDVLAAIIVPADTTQRLKAALALTGSPRAPTLEVIYNGADPLQARAVEATIKGRLADANQAISAELTKASAQYIDILLRGGGLGVLGADFNVLGLQRSEKIVADALDALPRDSPQRAGLEEVRRFARAAVENLDLAGPVLRSVGQPLKVQKQVINARTTPADRYYVAVALTLSALFVALLIGAGMLSLEREEHTFGRLARGLVTPLQLIAAKILLGALVGLAVTTLMACGVAIFVPLELGRAPIWLPVLAVACIAFGATGVALGALAKDVRAASLIGVLISLPIAFLALIPPSAMSPALFDLVRIISAPFAFRPGLQAVDGALSGGSFGLPLVHLVALIAVYGVIGRQAAFRIR